MEPSPVGTARTVPQSPPERSQRVSRTLGRMGFHNSIPLRIWKAPRPGRARLQSRRKPATKSTSREAAKEFSPRRKPWVKDRRRQLSPEGAEEVSSELLTILPLGQPSPE